MSCGKISANIAKACTNRILAGADNVLLLFNFDDWQKLTVTRGANPLTVTAITAPTGVLGFKIEGTSPNVLRPTDTLVRDTNIVSYNHSISMMIESATVATKEQIYNLQQGKVVAILFTNNKEILIYGHGTGLYVSDELIRDLYANGGSFMLPLATGEETLEKEPPLTYIGTVAPYDFAVEKAAIMALITA